MKKDEFPPFFLMIANNLDYLSLVSSSISSTSTVQGTFERKGMFIGDQTFFSKSQIQNEWESTTKSRYETFLCHHIQITSGCGCVNPAISW